MTPEQLWPDPPAWLFFAIYEAVEPHNKWNEDKDQIAKTILKKLDLHLAMHDIQNDFITQPNPYDDSAMYGNQTNELQLKRKRKKD